MTNKQPKEFIAVKHCKCGCVLSGNYHINLDTKYEDNTIKHNEGGVGTVYVKKCRDGCTIPKAK